MRQLIARVAKRLIPPRETLEGYEHPELVEVIFQKTKAYQPSGEWPEIAGATSVLDFGGACGIHYKQAGLPNVRWAVVDTPAMVARASELATDKLKFFSSIQEAADWLGPIDVMHSNGALQYTPAPETTLRQLCELGASRMIWGRLYFGQPEKQVSLLSENGPGQMRLKEKSVRYSRLGISEAAFLEAHQGYSLNRRDEGGFLFAAQIVPPIGRNEQGGVMK